MRWILATVLLACAQPALAATLAPVDADGQGRWTQPVRNSDAEAVDEVCVVADGTRTRLGCAGPVAAGATAQVQAQTPASQRVRAISVRGGLESLQPSADDRMVNVAQAPTPPPSGNVQISLVGDPASGDWGLAGSITTTTAVTRVEVYQNGALHHTEVNSPYGFPDDGAVGRFGDGVHVIEFRFFAGDGAELGRGSMTVTEGSAPPPPPPPAVCGDGARNGSEVCDGAAGCAVPSTCAADCSACNAPPPPPIPAPGCLTPLPGASMVCTAYGTAGGLRCDLRGQLNVEGCPGAGAVAPNTCWTFPTADLYCEPSGTRQKCRISTTAAYLEPCR